MKTKKLLSSCLLILFFTSVVSATAIMENSGWDVTIIPPASASVYLFTDGIGNDCLELELYKVFDSEMTENDYYGQSIVLKFTKTSASAPNQIVIRDEYVENATGQTWEDFHMQLSTQVDVDPQKVGFHPDYLFTPNTSLNPFQTVEFDENSYTGMELDDNPTPILIHFRNGQIPNGTIWQPGWQGSTENDIRILSNLQPGESFLLKEFPTIPEPATFVLFGIGMVPALLVFRKRK